MGKLNYDSTIQHFSHCHPLELLNTHQQQQTQNLLAPCSGCKLAPSGLTYNCKSCNYNLHISCSQMPQLINHPCDPNHALTLLVSPAYPGGRFKCDACGRKGDGFSYHCSICNLDIHTVCASKPLSVNHQSHCHTLNLVFSPPYQVKGFSCNICHKIGSNHWLYRCNTCEFNAHIGCATAKSSVTQQHQRRLQHRHQSFPAANHVQSNFNHPGAIAVSTESPHVQGNLLTAQSFPIYNQTQYQNPRAGQTRPTHRPPMQQQQQQQQQQQEQGDILVQTAIGGFIDFAVQLAGQSPIQDIMGDGGYGVDPSNFPDVQWSVQDNIGDGGNGVVLSATPEGQWSVQMVMGDGGNGVDLSPFVNAVQDIIGDSGDGVDLSVSPEGQWSVQMGDGGNSVDISPLVNAVQNIIGDSGNGVDLSSFLNVQW